jgi:predicted MPP superfamily phosphohydrolase
MRLESLALNSGIATDMAKRSAPKRFLRRRGDLITLRLNGTRDSDQPSPKSQQPELTETDIFMRRLPHAFDGLSIVHLTDIHHSVYTALETVEETVHLANHLHPDLVALTGDYVTLSPSYIWPVARALGRLRARLGVFAVLGNHDFQVDADEITRALRAQQIRVLRNSHFALRSRGATLWLAGVDDLWWNADDFQTALAALPAREAKILLCHNPIGIRQAVSHGVDFVLSGHTHGGQVRLPLLGSLRGRSKLGQRFVEGWNRLDGTQIYVSRGIGNSVVPLRLNCPPEIAYLRLRRPS